jgi:phage baseplate assembly protein W
MAYSLKFPIDYDLQDGLQLINDVVENSKQNLKMIIMTNPGERIMNPDFGVGLKRILFENLSNGNYLDSNNRIQNIERVVSNKIIDQLQKYAPNMSLISFTLDFDPDSNSAYATLNYAVSGMVADPLQIQVQ